MSFSFVNSVANGATLFVGEGNFSFCLSIARQVRYPSNIIATTFENQNEFSEFTKANISKLQSLGVRVFYNSDATKFTIILQNVVLIISFFNFRTLVVVSQLKTEILISFYFVTF